MSAISKLVVSIGLLSLFHAAYSAYEHSTRSAKLHTHTHEAQLPIDIIVETLVSLGLVCFGLVVGSEPLKPISWSTWAGNIEKEGGGSNPFRTLEDRVNFMDIRTKRKEFADWVRQGGSVDIKS